MLSCAQRNEGKEKIKRTKSRPFSPRLKSH